MHLHILCYIHHPVHAEIKIAQGASAAGILVFGGTNLNTLFMISFGIQMLMSVVADVILMVKNPENPDSQENSLKPQQLIQKQSH